jgi:hypothetical protein
MHPQSIFRLPIKQSIVPAEIEAQMMLLQIFGLVWLAGIPAAFFYLRKDGLLFAMVISVFSWLVFLFIWLERRH